MSAPGRLLKAVTLALWHFVVGDSPEFLVAVFVVVGFAVAAHRVHALVWLGLPLLVLAVLGVSLWRHQRARPSQRR